MARVKYVQYDEASPELKGIFDQMAPSSRPGNIYKALGNSPQTMGRLHHLVALYRGEAPLPRKIGELAIVLTTELEGARYVYLRHARMALAAGATKEQVKSVKNYNNGLFDPTERAALAFTDELVRTGDVSDATFEALRQHFDDQLIVELTVNVGAYILASRFAKVMRLEDEPGFQPPDLI